MDSSGRRRLILQALLFGRKKPEHFGQKAVHLGMALDSQQILAVFHTFHHSFIICRPCIDGHQILVRRDTHTVKGRAADGVAT